MLIQSGPCVTKMAPYNSATKNRVSSKHACSRATWTTTSRPSCGRSIQSTTWTASTPMVGRPSAACLSVTVKSAASSRLPAPLHTGACSMIASSSSGRSTMPSPKKKTRTASSSPTSAAMFAEVPISIASARSPPGSRRTTRAAPMMTQPCGDVPCRGVSAMP